MTFLHDYCVLGCLDWGG